MGEIRIGTVSAIDAAAVRCKVTFDDLTSDTSDALISDWLPVVQHGGGADQGYWLPNVGTQVVVAMLSNAAECGFVIGTIFSPTSTAPVATGAGKWYQRFADGSILDYDPGFGWGLYSPGKISITATGGVEIN